MLTFSLTQVGVVRHGMEGTRVVLDEAYRPALEGLEGFSHVQVLWWFSGADTWECRDRLTEESPYREGPERLGTFATRSPARPNPIALSCAQILHIDIARGEILVAYLDADEGSPVLDIKPYTPSLDRVENPRVPDWCAQWPRSLEASATFDWDSVFGA